MALPLEELEPVPVGKVFGGRPTVLGHRGLGRGPGENTPDSLRQAVEVGVRWVETDVRRTADDELVVGHHPTWEDGSFVADLTLAQARGQGACSLTEYLADLPAGIGVNLDVKSCLEDALRPPEETTAGLLAPAAAEVSRERPVLATSFDPSAVLQLRAAAPELALGLLTWVGFPLRKAVPAAAHLGVDVLAAHWASFGPNDIDHAPVHRPMAEAIEVAHRAGLEVAAWCPGVGPARELLTAGADAVVVDDVAQTLPALRDLAD